MTQALLYAAHRRRQGHGADLLLEGVKGVSRQDRGRSFWLGTGLAL